MVIEYGVQKLMFLFLDSDFALVSYFLIIALLPTLTVNVNIVSLIGCMQFAFWFYILLNFLK